MDREELLGISPWPELLIRKVYYSENKLIKNAIKALTKKHKNKKENDIPVNDENWQKVKTYISSLDINHGDLLIIHSSAEELSKLGVKPNEVLSYLFEIVGETGTIAIPCFPLYDEKNFDAEKETYIYNPKRTVCSTGLLPNLFIRTKGVIRSQFPWNSLAAKGPLSEKMMEHNLDIDLAHGKGSAWEYAMNHGAKILLLGVKASHTTTMVHVAEDILDDRWPIKDWYEKKRIIIKNGDEEKCLEIRVRKPEWAKYNASWYRSSQFVKNSILFECKIEGFNVGFIRESKKMVDYIIERTLNRKPFFVVPKRYYKNEE